MLLNFDYFKSLYKFDIRGILHIGAHYGQEYELYKRHNIKDIIFFEPLKENFKVLTQNVSTEEGTILINKALGNQTRKVEMYVESANQGQSSSILRPNLHLKQYPHITFDEKETVEMIRLDDLSPLLNLEKYNMINMDVQGYELEVFRGGSKYLNHVDYIFTEVNRDMLYENNAMVEEIDSFLSEYGFSRVATNWQGNTWGDALYVKDEDDDDYE